MTSFKNLFPNFVNLTEKEILLLNGKALWSLNLRELKELQKYYKKIGRPPLRGEMETIAQTWSEHCKHKTFSGPVIFKNGKKKKNYSNLFKETIVKATKTLNRPWCLSVFADNAGIIELSPKSEWAVAFKAETHNHPCAIAPYGGAETGVGGVIRDILGVGLGAKPVLNTDTFCFGLPDSKIKLPKNAIPSRRIFRKVVEGVRDYGNRMGIPTAAGGIFFDDDYALNPLVYVGSAGIIPKNKIKKKPRSGDIIAAIGGRTGRDGIHGATFSSANIDESAISSAVQIGHALNEKKFLDALMKARDLNLYSAITDCGAGGFSSAVGELAEKTGARVFLEKALLKDSKIEPWEIWVSESQERMILAVPPKNLPKLKKLLDEEESEYSILGKFTNDKKLLVTFKDEKVVELDMAFLHHKLPEISKKAIYSKSRQIKKPPRKIRKNHADILKEILNHINVCSRHSVIRQYDFEVQGGTVIKPLEGKNGAPSDCAVIWPHAATGNMKDFSGFAAAHGFNPLIGKISPFQMALEAADEAIRNLLCSGANIEKTALMDNFCAGSPSNPKIMGDFVMAAEGLKKAALDFKAPFISGKDSFYNQSKDAAGKQKSIPLSILVSAIAPFEDIRKAITIGFKYPGNPVYLAGETKKGMGSSIYNEIEFSGNNFISSVDTKYSARLYRAILKTMKKDCVPAAHDISQGGFAAALSEMAFAGKFGVRADISLMPAQKGVGEIEKLFGESSSRILLEADAKREKQFLKMTKGFSLMKIGEVSAKPVLEITNKKKRIIFEKTSTLLKWWKRDLL